LLADGTTARLLKRIPEEIKAGGVNMKYHLEEARVALGDLESICRLSPKDETVFTGETYSISKERVGYADNYSSKLYR